MQGWVDLVGWLHQWRRNYGDRGYILPPPQVQHLYPLYPRSQRCGLCQNFKQTTLTTRLYNVHTNLHPRSLRKRSDAPRLHTEMVSAPSDSHPTVNCTTFGKPIRGKVIKIVAARCRILKLKWWKMAKKTKMLSEIWPAVLRLWLRAFWKKCGPRWSVWWG